MDTDQWWYMDTDWWCIWIRIQSGGGEAVVVDGRGDDDGAAAA